MMGLTADVTISSVFVISALSVSAPYGEFHQVSEPSLCKYDGQRWECPWAEENSGELGGKGWHVTAGLLPSIYFRIEFPCAFRANTMAELCV